MKVVVLITLCTIAQVFSQDQDVGFNSCPVTKTKTKAVAPPAGKWFQVIKENKNDTANCYTLTITGSDTKIKIVQAYMVATVGFFNGYDATANVNGTWDVKMIGAPSSITQFTTSKNLIEVLSCKQLGLLTLQPGIYTNSNNLTAAELATAIKALEARKFTKKDYMTVDPKKCNN